MNYAQGRFVRDVRSGNSKTGPGCWRSADPAWLHLF